MKTNRLLLFIFILSYLSACSPFYPHIMFKDSKNKQPTITSNTTVPEYILKTSDRLYVDVFSNNGYELANILTENSVTNISNQRLEYIIDVNGYVKLPIIDTVLIKGKTVNEAIKLLEEKYSKYLKDPFVSIRINNKRVFVFTGEKQNQVVLLDGESISLIEVLAKAGGIPSTGKAKMIKIIRGDLTNPEVIIIDLSTIEGMRKADMTILPNDIIYVMPVRNFARKLTQELTPLFTILNLILTTVTIAILAKRI